MSTATSSHEERTRTSTPPICPILSVPGGAAAPVGAARWVAGLRGALVHVSTLSRWADRTVGAVA